MNSHPVIRPAPRSLILLLAAWLSTLAPVTAQAGSVFSLDVDGYQRQFGSSRWGAGRQPVELRLEYLLQPSSHGAAGDDLATDPWLILVDGRGYPRFEPLRDLTVGAYLDAKCTVPASGTVSAQASPLLAYFGLAVFGSLTESAAGSFYFKVSARDIQGACSAMVSIAPGAPDHLALVGGDGQSGAPNSMLPKPAQVRVLDAHGNSVGGVSVTFTATTGGGSALPGSVTSDGTGLASASLRTGTATGSDTWLAAPAKVSLRGHPATISFSATVLGGAATQLALSGPATQGAGSCSGAFVVNATDKSGRTVNQASSLAVNLTGLGHGALFADDQCAKALSSLSIPAGASTISFFIKDTRAETLGITASATGLGSSTSVTDTVAPGPAAALGFSQQPAPAAVAGVALGIQPVLKVLDAYGNAVPQGGFDVRLSASLDPLCQQGEDAGLGVTSNPMHSQGGLAAFAGVRATLAGTFYLQAVADGLKPACSNGVVLAAAAPARLFIASGDGQSVTAGASLAAAPIVLVTDAYQNAVAGAGLSFSTASAGAQVSPASALTDAQGHAQASFSPGDSVGTVTLNVAPNASGVAWATPAQGEASPAVAFSATVTAATADHVMLLSGDGQSGIAGQALAQPAQVQAVDAFGNPVAGVSINFAITAGGGSAQPAQAMTDAHGLAATTFTLGSALGAQSLSATGATLAGTPASITFNASALPGAPAILALGSGGGTAAGVAGSCSTALTVALRDAGGNASPATADLSVTLAGGGSGAFFADAGCTQALAGGSLVIPSGRSVAAFYARDTVAESLMLTAAASGLTGSTLPFTVQPAASARLAFSTQPATTAVAGQALSAAPSVAVLDAYGNRVSAATDSVRLAAFADAACASPLNAGAFGATANPQSAVSGLASFAGVSETAAGTFYLGAAAAGLSGACSVAVQVTAATAASLALVQGDAQSGVVGSVLGVAPTVRATDAFGNPVSGATVQFTVTAGGGSVSAASAVTDTTGQAGVGFTLGAAPGSNALQAALAGASATVSFNATALPRPSAALQLAGPATISAGACSAAFSVNLLDAAAAPTVAGDSAVMVSLSGAGAGAFYSDAACAQPITQVSIAAGQGSVAVYVADPSAQSLTLAAQAAGLSPANAACSVQAGAATRLVFSVAPPASASVGQALSTQPMVSAQDAYGNPASAFQNAITLSAYADAACATPAGGALSADMNPVTASSGQVVFSGVAYGSAGVVYLGASAGGLASACSSAITLAPVLPMLAAGTAHTCAAKDGAVKCWGFNSAGQLGNGTNANASVPQAVTGLDHGVVALGAGSQHSCAARADGVMCWGSNLSGQLGNGSTQNSASPVAVSAALPGVRQVVAGDSHTCALGASGLQCWGDNTYGQLGNGTFVSSTVPVSVTGLPAGSIQSVAAGSDTTCVVMDSGDAYCWGFNDFGQLGNGSTQNSSAPVRVGGLPGPVVSMAPGVEHTCALVAGSVYCWGANGFGQLGEGTFHDNLVPQLVSGFSSPVTTLLSGGQNFNCAIVAQTTVQTGAAGAVQCWGQNTRGQLGDNRASGAQSNVPVQVVGLTSGYQVLHAGYVHACASDGNHIVCWGWGTTGQLGNGQNLASAVPVSVVGY